MVAEVFGNVLGNLFGGFMGQQANAQGVLLSAQEQKKLMDHQAKVNWKYYQKELQNRWQLAREGLEKGNYNPMLALQGINGNSTWTNQASISDTGAGTAFNAGMANAQGVAQLRQQAELNDSTIGLNNANEIKTEMETMSEISRNLNIQADTQLKDSERRLNDKDLSSYDYKLAQKDKEIANETKRIANEYKLGLGQIALGRQSNMLQQDIINQQRPINSAKALQEQWSADHPYQSRLLPGVPGAAAGVGGALILRGKTPMPPQNYTDTITRTRGGSTRSRHYY